MTASGWHRKTKNTPAERARRVRYTSSEYRAAERALKAEVDAGRGFCWRCGGWIDPSVRVRRGRRLVRAWHVGHDDRDQSLIRGPEHEKCNLPAAARKGARVRNVGGKPPRRGGATRVRL